MTELDYGALVVRRDIDNRMPFKPGDEITTYVLGEPYPYLDLPPHSGHSREHSQYELNVIAKSQPADWALRNDLRCDCKQRRSIAQVLVHLPDSRLWVSQKVEHAPASFREERNTRTTGWALHGREGEAPHVGGVTSCKGCRTRWLVVSFVNRAEMFRIRSATRGHVAP